MKITTIGIDLAKNVFAVYGVNKHGRVVLKKVLKRNHVTEFVANLATRVIGMEACASAHYLDSQATVHGTYGTTDRATVCQTVREDE